MDLACLWMLNRQEEGKAVANAKRTLMVSDVAPRALGIVSMWVNRIEGPGFTVFWPQIDKMNADAGAGAMGLWLTQVRISLRTLLHQLSQTRLAR